MASSKLLALAGAASVLAAALPLTAAEAQRYCHRMPVSNEFSDPDGCDIGGPIKVTDPSAPGSGYRAATIDEDESSALEDAFDAVLRGENPE